MLEEIKLNPSSWTTSIYGNGNGDGIVSGDVNGIVNNPIQGKGGLGEKPETKFIVPSMLQVFKKHLPLYGEDISRDYPPLQSISQYIFEYFKMPGDFLTNQQKILDEWDIICQFIKKDAFYNQKSLKTISNHIQEMVNKSIHGTSKKQTASGNTTADGKHQSGLDALLARGQQKYASAGGGSNNS